MFTPRKFQAKLITKVGGDLWAYLTGGREQADYYLRPDGTPDEAAAELHGRLWTRLGLDRLDRAAFQRLAAGLHPRTGARLVKASYATTRDPATGTAVARGGMRVPGIDCNLSPPKSVSALLPFVPGIERAALERAHHAAVRVTLTELEARVAACRPTVNGEQVHTPGELAVAVFTHHTSRPTPETAAEPGRPPDPQLHSHAFIFNLAFCEGRYLAVDSRPVYQFATTAEAIYACQLAAELQRLGYQLTWQQTRTGRIWEVAGVDRRLTDLFSSRRRHLHQQVTEFQARRHRPPTLRERDRLAARDRAPKTNACSAPHWAAYHAVLRRHRLQAPVPHRQRHGRGPAPLAEREAAVRARLLGTDGLTRNDATFDTAALTKATFQAATGLLDATEARAFLDRFTAGPDLVPVATPHGPRYTTKVLLAQEHKIVHIALAKATTRTLAPRPEQLAHAAERAALWGPRLSKEQLAALRHLAAPVGWASLEGRAGTGKTTLLRTLLRAYRANFQPVVLVSTAAETARRTARELDLERGYTVEAFARAVATGHLQPRPDWVVLVEEAATVDTPRMATLLDAAGPAAIRTLGDPEQAQPVGPGGWQQLVDAVVGGHAQLTRVVRQRDPADREACQAIRDGRAPQALASLHARGRLFVSPDRSTAVKEVVHAWDRHRAVRGLDGVAVVTDTDNRTVDVLNALCQARREANGEFTGPAVTVVDRAHGRCERLFAGDRVRFVRPYRANDDLRTYVPNGTAGHVQAVDLEAGEVVVRADDGRVVAVQPGVHEDAQPLRLGYAGHALKLQGGQAAVVLVLPGGWQTSRQSAYSMTTRCVEEVHVFVDAATQRTGAYHATDPIHALGERWTRDARKHGAFKLLDDQRAPHRASARSCLDDDLVAALPEPHDPAMTGRACELAREREIPDGLGIEL